MTRPVKLSLMPIIERTIAARTVVLGELRAVSLEGGSFAVSINGTRQDDAMHAVARVAMERELQGRLASLNRDLESYGIEVD